MKKISGICSKIFVSVFIIINFNHGCSSKYSPNLLDVKNKLDSLYVCSNVTSDTSMSLKRKFSKRIYVLLDASGSTKGFLTYESRYQRFVRRIHAWGETRDVTYFKFGASTRPIPCNIRQAFDVDFYDQPKTFLIGLLNNFTDSSLDSFPSAYILITDLCESSSEKDIIGLIRPTIKLIQSGYKFALIGMKSEFKGNVYSEMAGGVNLGFYDSDIFGDRPFYCLIFSVDDNIIWELLNIAKEVDLNAKFFNLENVPKVSKISYLLESQSGKFSGIDIYEMQGKNNECVHFYWRGESPTFINMVVKFSLPQGDSLINFKKNSNPILLVEGRDWSNLQKFVENLSVDSVKFESDSQLVVRFSAYKGDSDGWDVYLIRGILTRGTLQVPKWIGDWSTNKDTSKEYLNKTLFLDLYMQSLVDHLFEGKEFFRVYFLLNRR